MGEDKNNGRKKANVKKALDDSAEFLIIALLLTNELVLDAIEIDREGTVLVTLEGKLNKQKNGGNAEVMAEFLQNNGQMTLNDVMEGLRRHLNRTE